MVDLTIKNACFLLIINRYAWYEWTCLVIKLTNKVFQLIFYQDNIII